jgi:hypothetical protein
LLTQSDLRKKSVQRVFSLNILKNNQFKFF